VVHVDGSSANQRSGVGVTITNPEGERLQYAIKLDFVTTNNEAEYEAILAGLSIAWQMGALNVEVRSDSQVVVGHVQGQFEAQGDKMMKYLDKVRECQSYFDRVVLTKIPQEDNARAVALSKLGSGIEQNIAASTHEVIIQVEPSIASRQAMMQVNEAPTNLELGPPKSYNICRMGSGPKIKPGPER
jgi:ribonuclease HI